MVQGISAGLHGHDRVHFQNNEQLLKYLLERSMLLLRELLLPLEVHADYTGLLVSQHRFEGNDSISMSIQ